MEEKKIIENVVEFWSEKSIMIEDRWYLFFGKVFVIICVIYVLFYLVKFLFLYVKLNCMMILC